MKIIALPDLHGAIDHLSSIADDLLAADLVLLVGDLTNSGNATDASRVVNAVRRYNPHILAVPGNLDDTQVCDYLVSERISLDGRHVVIDQIALLGAGAAIQSIFRTPNEITETDMDKRLANAVLGLDPSIAKILVCHQPPVNTLNDRTRTGLHVGSQAVRNFIETEQPLICFTGHIHEGIGIDTIGKTKIVNPGPLWQGGYAYAHVTCQGIVALEIRRRAN